VRVALLHAFMDILGGGEYLMLHMARAISLAGGKVDLYTVTEPDWGEIERVFGIENPRSIFNEVYVHGKLNPFRRGKGRFVRFKRLLVYHGFFKMFNREHLRDRYDLVIDTQSNTASPVDIAYIHYPVIAETYTKHTPVYDAYSLLVKMLYKAWFGKPMSKHVLTNSSWTAKAIKQYYGVEARVLYPPVDVSSIMSRCRDSGREDVIVTVSRLTPEKNLPQLGVIAAAMPSYEYIVMGRRDDETVYNELIHRGVNVNPDVSRDVLIDTLCRAKYYVHPLFREHFGIAVVEAMAAGLVPLVYYDSGSCTDIVSHVDKRLCYKNLLHAAYIINWIEKHGLWEELSRKARMVAEMFSVENFYRRVRDTVSSLL